MSIGGEVYDVGTVAEGDGSHTTVIAGIVLGILAALVAGAALALIVMRYLRKKKSGEETMRREKKKKKAWPLSFARVQTAVFLFPSANIENRLSTMLSHTRSWATADISPTGDYRRGESGRFIHKRSSRKLTL